MANRDLYTIAREQGIEVYSFPMDENGSSSEMTNSGNCYIAIDNWALSNAETERVHLAHELGHCVTGSFYNPYSKLDIRGKHEHKADKWAIEHVIPLDMLFGSFRNGITEPWELAETFCVPQWFMDKALDYYQNTRPLGA
jgi:hypothetical protein